MPLNAVDISADSVIANCVVVWSVTQAFISATACLVVLVIFFLNLFPC